MSKITIERSVVEQALEALNATMATHGKREWIEAAKQQADATLRSALEQSQGEQKPVAWILRDANNHKVWFLEKTGTPTGYRGEWIKTPLYTRPQPQREPLTDAQINDHRLALPYDGEDLPDPWDFKQGVRAAERVHRIGGEA